MTAAAPRHRNKAHTHEHGRHTHTHEHRAGHSIHTGFHDAFLELLFHVIDPLIAFLLRFRREGLGVTLDKLIDQVSSCIPRVVLL